MRRNDKVIAILCSDIHLSAKPPRARRNELCWWEAMARPLHELAGLAQHYEVPILCAGDVFDYWRAEPELINFAISNLPTMFAIPGQHDLPLHQMDLIKRSAFWTMVLTDKIHPILEPECPVKVSKDLIVHGFPYGTRLQPMEEPIEGMMHVALCHEYLWMEDHSYTGAPTHQHCKRYRKRVAGWHAVAFGDNHKGFNVKINGVSVMNCGGFMRRTVDDVDNRTQVGLLCRSGTITPHRLSRSREVLTTRENEAEGVRKTLASTDLTDFLRGMEDLQRDSVDFIHAVEFALEGKQISNAVRLKILQALGMENEPWQR